MTHFTIDELVVSRTAKQCNIDNTPGAAEVKNLKNLIARVLDPARDKLGEKIIVNSGYRCKALNTAVGGAADSYHLRGRAADITTGTRSGNQRLYKILQQLPHTELINELNYTWIHVAL